jgi:hypothetical protein
MHRPLRVLLPLLFFALPVFASSGADPLWQKAVEISAAVKNWVPGEASLVLELVDDKGAVQESWRSWYHITLSATGSVTMAVTRAEHNGADTTQKELESQKKRSAMPFSMGDNPFDPLVQGAVAEHGRPDAVMVESRQCAVFDFTLKKKDGAVLSGTAWLDAESGAPVQVSYGISPLPRGVFRMTTRLRYAQGPGGEGYLKEAFVEGVAGVLFIKKSFRSAISVDGYWKRQSP